MDRDTGVNRPSQPVGRTVGTATVPVRAEADRDVVQQTTQVIAPRDRVRWGPIWAGLLTALTLFLLGSLLAIAIGAASAGGNAQNADDAGRITGLAIPIIAALAFGFGGAVAAKTAAVRGRGNGLLNGFLVWALAIPLILLLAASGLGAIFGAAGDLFGDLGRLGANRAADANINRQQVAEGIQNGAFGAFLSLFVPAVAASIGGLLGARKDDDRHVGHGDYA